MYAPPQSSRASRSMIAFVPNALSAMRLVLAFAFPVLPGEWRLPALIIGAVSDWTDGLIARRYQASTSSGAILDAVADKCFTLFVLVTLVFAGTMAWWQALLVLSRDGAVAGVSAWCVLVLRRSDAFRHMRPRLPGKVTTSLVFLWLIALLAGAPLGMNWTLFTLAAAGSIIAAADYLRVFVLRYPTRHTQAA